MASTTDTVLPNSGNRQQNNPAPEALLSLWQPDGLPPHRGLSPVSQRVILAAEHAIEQACADKASRTIGISRDDVVFTLVAIAGSYAAVPISGEDAVPVETLVERAASEFRDALLWTLTCPPAQITDSALDGYTLRSVHDASLVGTA